MKTGVFHITYFDYDKSLYLHYLECNFYCRGCIRKLSIWDCHLSPKIINVISKYYNKIDELKLNISALENIVKFVSNTYGVKKAILGGGEPTTDVELVNELRILNSIDAEVKVLTNGYLLDRYINVLKDVNAHIILSIKSIDANKHLMYTGRDLKTVLKNFEKAYRSGLKISIETILIPGFNEYNDIKTLAQYLSSINRDIELIIDSYIPVPGSIWRKPTDKELEDAYNVARKHLTNVYPRGLTISKPLGEVLLIYPHIPVRYFENFSVGNSE